MGTLGTGARRPSDFRLDRLLRLAEMQEGHFWFEGRGALLNDLIATYLREPGQRILDLGCATGWLVTRLHALGHRPIGIDILAEGLRAARELLQAQLLQADVERLPLRSTTLDAVFALDVLEHVDDRMALVEIERVLRPGGLAIITVPAMSWLWSYRDDDAGHRRRYGRAELALALEAAGLEPVRIRYFQFALFPLLVLSRFLGRLTPRARDAEDAPHSMINALLRWPGLLEVKLHSRFAAPWGSTLVAVARKPAP